MAINDAEREHMKGDRRENRFGWALILLPLFFLLGWWANDFTKTNSNNPQTGVGGGPSNISPTLTAIPSITITPSTTTIPTVSITITPSTTGTGY